MAWNLVVRKHDGRILFARDSSIPLYTQKLWSPVDHTYPRWDKAPTGFSDVTCHKYRLTRQGTKFDLILEEGEHDPLAKQKADALQYLWKILQRHSLTTSGEQPCFDEIMQFLADDVANFLEGQQGPFGFLEAYKQEHFAPDLTTAVKVYQLNMSLRRDQLIKVEQQRVNFTKQILDATSSDELTEIRFDLSTYERS